MKPFNYRLIDYSSRLIKFIFADQEEEKKKKEMKDNAKKELEEWYKHHKEAIEKTRLANRYDRYFITI